MSVDRGINYYNRDVIISVGHLAKSQQGTQLQIWATQRLQEYSIKRLTPDDERLKCSSGDNYFAELFARSQDIQSPTSPAAWPR
jgi:hypothetical protein